MMIKKDKMQSKRLRFGHLWPGVIILFLIVFTPAVSAQEQKQGKERFRIAGNGVAQCVIVQAADQTDPEKEAVADIKTYLEKITGAKFSVITEKEAVSGKPSIYVGLTDFAVKSGLDFTKFAEEEYCVKTTGNSLIVGGGRPNGTLNGVYHFLSRELGCRFFSRDCEVIPHREDLHFSPLNLRRKPSFAGRTVYLPLLSFGYTPEGVKKVNDYLRRNFGNQYQSAYDRISLTPDAIRGHNFFFWVSPRQYFTTNPEFFTNQKFNEPLEGRNQEGQLCWTNPKVWEITLQALREVIKKDRAELPKWKWPVVYQISQNDNQNYCRCANCAAAEKSAGSQAGPLLQYVNFVAEAIAREYPDVRILTTAYNGTEDAPKNIRPAANVIIQWCDLYTRSDCYRPLTQEFNAHQKARLDGWKKIGARIVVWDYWNMGIPGVYFEPPRVETMVDAIAPDLRYFAESGVEAFSAEAEFCHKNPQNFIDLQYYLGLQLAADVTLPEETLIKEFLAGCYGSAAPAMEKFLTLLRQAVKNEKEPLFYIYNPNRTYTDGAFLEKCYRLLKQAQAAVPPGSDYYRRVQQEIITPLAVILQNPQYDFFQRTGLKKKDIVAEYRAARLSRIEQPWVSVERQKLDKSELEDDLAADLLDIPVPDHLKHYKKILKFAWPNMQSGSYYSSKVELEIDPDSPTGKALVARSDEEASHDLNKPLAGGLYPNSFGIYCQSDKRSAATIRTDVLQDEKYHWYKIDAFDFGPNTFLWGFYWVSHVDLSTVYTAADGLPGYNVWETWISVKYTGPAYVKGSTQKNGVYIDRVILVKPEEDKNI